MYTESEIKAKLPPGGFLPHYVHYAEACMDAPLAIHVLTGLSILTQLVPIEAHVVSAQSIYPNLFGLIVGTSAVTRKSTAINMARSLLAEVDPSCFGPEPGSYPAFIDQMVNQPRQLITYSDFGGEFLARTTGVGGPMHELKGAYLKAWDNQPLTHNTRIRGSKECPNPRLSLLGASDPHFLEAYLNLEDWKGGFFSRFFVIYAKDRERFIPRPRENRHMRTSLIEYLTRLKNDTSPTPGPHMGFTRAAGALWDVWQADLDRYRRSGDAPAEVLGALQRADVFALKIAHLLAWDRGPARHGKPWKFTDDIIYYAITLTDLHVQSAIEVGRGIATDKDMRDRRTVLTNLRPEVQKFGDLLTKVKMLKPRLRNLLESLAEENLVECLNIPDSIDQGYRLRDGLHLEELMPLSTGIIRPSVPKGALQDHREAAFEVAHEGGSSSSAPSFSLPEGSNPGRIAQGSALSTGEYAGTIGVSGGGASREAPVGLKTGTSGLPAGTGRLTFDVSPSARMVDPDEDLPNWDP